MFTIEIDLSLPQQCFPCFFNIMITQLEFNVTNIFFYIKEIAQSLLKNNNNDLIINKVLLFNVLLLSE